MTTRLRYMVSKASILVIPSSEMNAKQKTTVAYRYISWFITSVFYLSGPPYNSYLSKLSVVAALFIFGRIIMDYYLKDATRKIIGTTIVIETVAITLILIPTGGLESPFIWYALNPVLIASIYLNLMYCWINLIFYFMAALLISDKLFNIQNLTIPEQLDEKSYVILVYILVTIVMNLLAHLIKQLDQQAEVLKEQRQELLNMNVKLQEANENVQRSMEYVMSLYHIIEEFSSRGDTRRVLKQVVDSAIKITESQGAFLWSSPYRDEPSDILANVSSEATKNDLLSYFNRMKDTFGMEEELTRFEINGVSFLATRAQSVSRFYGYIGIELSPRQSERLGIKNNELLIFLGELVSLVLERYDTEKLTSKLMIMEEQNRIANEIHDNVSQRLFSILCGIHALKGNWSKMDEESIPKQLQLIEQTTKDTSKELRSSIYRLSSNKRGERLFKDNLHNYLHDFASLNQVEVRFEFHGDEERISTSLKQALHRIIREASGNAVRHGHCTGLQVSLAIHAATLELIIQDNGRGFDTEYILANRESRGLGLNNMYILAQTFNGQIDLQSSESTGTTLRVRLPLGYDQEQFMNEKGGVA